MRDLIHLSTIAPSPTTDFIRPLWYIPGSELYLWNDEAVAYQLLTPTVAYQALPISSWVLRGIVRLATEGETLTGTDPSPAVSPLTLRKRLELLTGEVPSSLDTLARLAAALGNDPAFADNVALSLAQCAQKSGSNVNTPGLSSNDGSLVNTQALRAFFSDFLATPADIQNARDSATPTGSTTATGVSRAVSLESLASFTALLERTIVGGSTYALQSADDLISMDGATDVPVLNLGQPGLLKRKPYRITSINSTFAPVINASVAYPFSDGSTVKTLGATGDSLTVVPLSIGRWSIF